MICPHCNMSLPEGLIMCFHCGEPLETHAEPVAAYVQPEYQSEPVAPPHLVQETNHGRQTGGKKKGRGGIVAALAVVLLLGGAVGGHFLGFYTLPLLPERADEGITSPPSPAETPDTTQPGADETPDTATPGIAETPVDAPGQPGEGALNRFGYTDLDTQINTREDVIVFNPGSIGISEMNFTLTGDISDVAAVLIVGWRQQEWGNDQIVEGAESVIPIWKAEEVILRQGFNGQVSSGFPLWEEDIGSTLNVLMFVLDANYEPLGHVIIPVTIPEISEMTGSAGNIGDIQDYPVLLHDLPRIEIHVNPENPLHGLVMLKYFEIPERVIIGPRDPYTGSLNVQFTVLFASNREFVYEIGIHRFSVSEDHEGRSLPELNTQVWKIDINDGSGQGYDIGHAWITDVTDQSITWEFVLFDGADIDLNNLMYIGYDVRYQDEIDAQTTYGLIDGYWGPLIEETIDRYLMHYQ